jgi:hypothetical protein
MGDRIVLAATVVPIPTHHDPARLAEVVMRMVRRAG